MDIIKNLHPSKKYSFQTSPSGRTLPITVKQFLNCSHASEEIITVDDGFGCEAERVWSTYDGWNVGAYAKLVADFVAFIDKSQKVGSDFIDAAIHDELTVAEATQTWFEGSEISIYEIVHHANGTSGLIDIDIEGINTTRRVVLSMSIKKNDMFNIYYDESSKGGGTWDTDLVTTLNNYFTNKSNAA